MPVTYALAVVFKVLVTFVSVLLSEPQAAVPSADHLNICPLEPPLGICLFPEVVGCEYTVSLAAIVTVSLVASGVNVTLAPAVNVNVSVGESAATVVSPTLILVNAF